jgi:ActR/RegA family two-component response regulator
MDKIKALLIDDDIKFCQTFGTLSANTFDLEIAHSGTEGLNCLTKSPPHVVLIDLKLDRGINGLEILKRIKKSHPD